MSLVALDVALGFAGLYILSRLLSKKSPGSLPPGPKPKPLIGNLLDMPPSQEWNTFAEWGKLYGDISSVNIFGQNIVILNSHKAATDMLDKKSAIYSDRPVLQMGGELVGWRNTLVLIPYGDRFRNYRRLFHQCIGSHSNMARFHPVEETETRNFLRRVLATPTELAGHVRWTAGAIILRISHGYEVKPERDPFVNLADRATEQFSTSTAPGAFLVDLIPALKKVPDWMPGAGFKLKAKEWAATLQETVDMPFNFVKQQITVGTAAPSFTQSLLEGNKLTLEEEDDVKWSAASLYTGGADTTVAAIYAFFLAVTLHPEVQKEAQRELDAVVGQDRLPSYHDRENLPYINAVVLESLRWHAVTPTAIPHRVTEDNMHEGYFIPAGTLVMANIWQMLNDPRTYPDPFKFDPSRFIASEGKPAQLDPRGICFGFGRRTCPGQVLADASIFITAAMSLAVFDIGKCVENGVVIEPVHEQTTGTISHQLPFKCNIQPRSAKAVSLIQSDA